MVRVEYEAWRHVIEPDKTCRCCSELDHTTGRPLTYGIAIELTLITLKVLHSLRFADSFWNQILRHKTEPQTASASKHLALAHMDKYLPHARARIQNRPLKGCHVHANHTRRHPPQSRHLERLFNDPKVPLTMLKKLLYSPKTTTLYPYILILAPIAVAAVTTASTGTWTYTPAAWWVTFSLLMLGHGIWFYTMSANNFGKPTLYESCDEHGRPTKQAFDIAKQTYGRIHHHAKHPHQTLDSRSLHLRRSPRQHLRNHPRNPRHLPTIKTPQQENRTTQRPHHQPLGHHTRRKNPSKRILY